MSDSSTKFFPGFPLTGKDGQPLQTRDLRDGEAKCKFECGTIIHTKQDDGADGHCGACCQAAVDLRTARVKPLHEAAKKAAEEKIKKIKAAQAKAAKSESLTAGK